MARYKVLCTKKIDPLLVSHAKDKDIEVVEREFITIKPVLSKEEWKKIRTWLQKESTTHIAFTSQHAVEIVSDYLHQSHAYYIPNWKVFCLGGATKTMAELKHLTIAVTAKNAKDLATSIINAQVTEIVFFCSNKRRDDLPNLLNAAGVLVHEVIVYETMGTPFPSEPFDGILFFSPSAVDSFFSTNQLGDNTVCFAIGETTAGAIRGYAKNKIITSEVPKQETIMASVEFYFQNINCYE